MMVCVVVHDLQFVDFLQRRHQLRHHVFFQNSPREEIVCYSPERFPCPRQKQQVLDSPASRFAEGCL